MKQLVIIDTGPIVASINRKDPHHAWVLSALSECSTAALTCEAVLSEAFFLLQKVPRGKETLIALLARNVIQVPFHLSENAQEVRGLMSRYDNVPMAFADACLVRMSELYAGSAILTLDTDFLVYRKKTRHAIPLLAPFK